eukprot:scaffold1356_cov123-Cylindrotheca_fusiformis.AAC.14
MVALFLGFSILASSLEGVDRNGNEMKNNDEDKSSRNGNNININSEDESRPWGASSRLNDNSPTLEKTDENGNNNKAFGMGNGHSYIPLHEPPQGFRITSRVYTDPHDKLAHFDNESAMVFPYWECGVSGSTTVPIPLQHATVRHLLGGSQPNMYSGEEFGPHPQLVVALTSLEVVLNSGQKQTFQQGDIILLEDVVSGGHKLKGHGNQDMTVMILTLPYHYHQVGKDKSSLDTILKKNRKESPCKTGLERRDKDALPSKIGNAIRNLRPELSERTIRRTILTSIGLTLSTVAGDFMSKVAPLWLAVLFGGGCFVTGGTVAFVKIGEYSWNELQTWQERRQLQIQGEDFFKDHHESIQHNDKKESAAKHPVSA